MRQAVIDGDIARARELAEQAVEHGADLLATIEQGFAAGIREVGRLWDEGDYFLPELVQGAEAMKAAMAVINPALAAAKGEQQPKGRIVIGTVQGDLPDIGKTLVATLLEANGYQVEDLGADVPIDTFVERARATEADVVAASALLTTTMGGQRTLVGAVADAGLAKPARVLVGGSATTPTWAEAIGASFAENAQRAVLAVEKLCS